MNEKENSDCEWWEELQSTLSADSRLKRDVCLAKMTTFGVGGKARFYVEPGSVKDLQSAVARAREWKCPIFFLGRGSNLLVPDEGFDGMIVRLNRKSWREVRPKKGNRLWTGGGVRLKEICRTACKLGMSGFEFLEGIPGTLGGGLVMNAGAMGNWIFDLVEEVEYMRPDGELRSEIRDRFHIGYRECRELKDAVVVGALLRARETDGEEAIREKLNRFSRVRRESQPAGRNAGCIFKNPEDGFAGQIIDELGLKGRCVGGAQISTLHGNFIVNRGDATCADVIALIREVRGEVRRNRGIDLQPEVLLLGRDWDEVL